MGGKNLDARAIFKVACFISAPEGRDAYLKQVCGDNGGVYDRVVALLQAHDDGTGFLESPATGVAATVDMPPIAERPGTKIGRYKLLQEIGEGGMGVVYMAQQKEPVKRKVALKIIKPGMDTKEVVARFEAERQALAMMDHPNISKVLDGGTTESGRPYFVMELVHGVPLTEYCDENQLTTRERLELFVKICQAVQHAHQKGIIHRDIKPSNVMVTLHDHLAVPKIIDFGIAKATNRELTEKTIFTGYGQMVGTPLYMSPEQAQMSGLDIDTRTDIYSLGVLLYELLTGNTPFDRERVRGAEFDEVRRMIREEEPPRPSARFSTLAAEAATTISAHRKTDPIQLNHLLKGELDWIVMKSLEKDRNRRYETANNFAVDIHRYLDDEPVEACPPSTTYRLRKFARRHKAQLLTAATIAAVLVVATVVSSFLAAWAIREKGVASENLVVARRNEATADRERAAALDAKTIARRQEKLARLQRDAAEYDLYVSSMRLATRDWMDDQTARLSDTLATLVPDVGRPDYRGWEWYYFLSVSHKDSTTLRQHTVNTQMVAWSPNGSLLAWVGYDNAIRFWDVTARREAFTLTGHEADVYAIAWNPDGRQIATGSLDRAIKIWDANARKEVITLRGAHGRDHMVGLEPRRHATGLR